MSVKRVEQLIALACSTESTEEARTAAMTAVRLMQKHGYRVTASVDDDDYEIRVRPPGRWRPPPPSETWWVDRDGPRAPGEPPRAGRWDPEHVGDGPPRNPVALRCHGCRRAIQRNERRFVGSDGTHWCAAH